MTKKTLRVIIGESVAAPLVWEMSELSWHDGKISCPRCKQFVKPEPLLDVIQYGLFRGDNCYTVFFCEATGKYWACHYENKLDGNEE